ncbi:MAG: YegP family protein [Verrucomicrobiales bacterium]|nr:YegP family protein [Verrucomicrobiales bacterium]
MPGKFRVSKTTNGKFKFNLYAVNGRIILTSQTYATKASALKGVESVRTCGVDLAQFDRRTASNGQPYFVLLAKNKQVIGNSEMYSGLPAMEKGIVSVTKHAADAKLFEDLG